LDGKIGIIMQHFILDLIWICISNPQDSQLSWLPVMRQCVNGRRVRLRWCEQLTLRWCKWASLHNGCTLIVPLWNCSEYRGFLQGPLSMFVWMFWTARAIFQLSGGRPDGRYHYRWLDCKFRPMLSTYVRLLAEDSFTCHTYFDTGPSF
jgi:hypothetical protein